MAKGFPKWDIEERCWFEKMSSPLPRPSPQSPLSRTRSSRRGRGSSSSIKHDRAQSPTWLIFHVSNHRYPSRMCTKSWASLRTAHVWANATVGTVCASAALLGSVHLQFLPENQTKWTLCNKNQKVQNWLKNLKGYERIWKDKGSELIWDLRWDSLVDSLDVLHKQLLSIQVLELSVALGVPAKMRQVLPSLSILKLIQKLHKHKHL